MLFTASSVFLYHYKKRFGGRKVTYLAVYLEYDKRAPAIRIRLRRFQANYMDEQAQFFRTHPNSRYAQLADDVKSPFNEYLGVLTDSDYRRYGHASLCRRAFPYVEEHPGGSSRPALLCLTTIAVFSLFSYPFRYPHTWILCMGSALVFGYLTGIRHYDRQRDVFLFVTALLLTTALCFRIQTYAGRNSMV